MKPRIVHKISASGLTIYDDPGDRPELFIETGMLERILDNALRGSDLNYPLRTRSKIVKQRVCEALGYPIPLHFRKTQPRFPAQNFDTYVQKGNNLQIWNEELSVSRRYVLVRVDENHVVVRVRVVSGNVIARLDKTGTLTHKYQAKARVPVTGSQLVSRKDTDQFLDAKQTNCDWLSIAEIYQRLIPLTGTSLLDPGQDQERLRGAVLHGLVADQLGSTATDAGQFPDVLDQVLEVKLQTASTIDLGLVCPDHTEPILAIPRLRQCDARYAIFYGATSDARITLEHLVLCTGQDFFKRFRRFEGNVKNSKLQIPLPSDFFL